MAALDGENARLVMALAHAVRVFHRLVHVEQAVAVALDEEGVGLG